ncbi:MAG TPA: hypothetical protein VEC12_12165 [Bacteroidia bacterium]|nr:hypothetical protein [Bacteroidia bacterium]
MANGYATGYGLNNRFPTPDADAMAFINAAGITDATQVSAINTLVIELKGNGLWEKFHAIYPFVGGTAASHSYNLVNPSSYQILWSASGVTHNGNGITGNGSTGYGDTQYIIPPSLQNNFHISVYVRNNVDSKCAIGCLNSGAVVVSQIYPRSSNQFEGDINQNVASASSNSDSRGFFCASRLNSSINKGYKNENEVISFNINSLTPANTPLYLLARKGSSVVDYSSYNLAFATIGTGLIASENIILYQVSQQYQLKLSREV